MLRRSDMRVLYIAQKQQPAFCEEIWPFCDGNQGIELLCMDTNQKVKFHLTIADQNSFRDQFYLQNNLTLISFLFIRFRPTRD